jgi:NAD(P)-dependent dehydrogenase (short-subunit alcohol dehydrogenase family)
MKYDRASSWSRFNQKDFGRFAVLFRSSPCRLSLYKSGQRRLVLRPPSPPPPLSSFPPTHIQEAYKAIASAKEPLVALVNNAGISTRSPLEATPMKLVRMVYEVNVFGLTHVTQTFLPLLRANQGRIINIGSVAGLLASDSSSTYSGTKFAVEAITDSLRRELASFGISVSLVEPVSCWILQHSGQKSFFDGSGPAAYFFLLSFLFPNSRLKGLCGH